MVFNLVAIEYDEYLLGFSLLEEGINIYTYYQGLFKEHPDANLYIIQNYKAGPSSIPLALVEKLSLVGTSRQKYRDGYEAFRELRPWLKTFKKEYL